MKKITTLFTIGISSFCLQAQTFIGAYTFDSVKTTTGTTDPSFLPTATGVTFGSFTAVGTPVNPNAAARFSFTNWPTGSTGGIADSLYSGMTGSLSPTEYYQFTISPATWYSISLDTISFTSKRSSTGFRSYSVRSSADGYATNIVNGMRASTPWVSIQGSNEFYFNHDTSSNTYNNVNGNYILLSGSTFSNLTSPVSFRFYAWNAEASGGSFGIDNVRVHGVATLTTGIHETTFQSISVYPNPSSSGIYTIDLGNNSDNALVKVYDIVGNMILEKEINAENKLSIDLSNKANGSYFIQIRSNNTITTKKITIVK